jgi:hypothetical protein
LTDFVAIAEYVLRSNRENMQVLLEPQHFRLCKLCPQRSVNVVVSLVLFMYKAAMRMDEYNVNAERSSEVLMLKVVLTSSQ